MGVHYRMMKTAYKPSGSIHSQQLQPAVDLGQLRQQSQQPFSDTETQAFPSPKCHHISDVDSFEFWYGFAPLINKIRIFSLWFELFRNRILLWERWMLSTCNYIANIQITEYPLDIRSRYVLDQNSLSVTGTRKSHSRRECPSPRSFRQTLSEPGDSHHVTMRMTTCQGEKNLA